MILNELWIFQWIWRSLFDYSKTQIDDECRAELLKLVELQRVEKFKNAMFSGDKINRTEDRSVLHMALRNKSETKIFSDGENVMPKIFDTIEKCGYLQKVSRKENLMG